MTVSASLEPGTTFTIEPMLTPGGIDRYLCDNNWTVLIKDGPTAAQWEHTLDVPDDGAGIQTVPCA